MAKELGRPETPVIGDAAAAALERHPWPGNVRGLKNLVERAVDRTDTALISEVEFDPFRSPHAPLARPERPAREETPVPKEESPKVMMKAAVWDLQVRMLEAALRRAQYNQRKAAAALGLTYNQFRGLYRRYRTQRRETME